MNIIVIIVAGLITLVSLLGNLYLVITVIKSIRKPNVKVKTKKK